MWDIVHKLKEKKDSQYLLNKSYIPEHQMLNMGLGAHKSIKSQKTIYCTNTD